MVLLELLKGIILKALYVNGYDTFYFPFFGGKKDKKTENRINNFSSTSLWSTVCCCFFPKYLYWLHLVVHFKCNKLWKGKQTVIKATSSPIILFTITNQWKWLTALAYLQARPLQHIHSRGGSVLGRTKAQVYAGVTELLWGNLKGKWLKNVTMPRGSAVRL